MGGSLRTDFVCPAPRPHQKETVDPERRDMAAAALRMASASPPLPRPPRQLPIAYQACSGGEEAVYFRTAIIQDGANVCCGLQGGRLRWPADLARSDWHS